METEPGADASHCLTESKTFCMLPWVHMNVWTDGKVFPCCMAEISRPLGSLRETPLAEIWNSPGLRRMRTNMRAGTESPECHKCYELDRSGVPSLRRRANDQFGHHYPEVEETAEDGHVAQFRMPYMDIRFSNICNFRCRTCFPELSSAWHADGKKLHGDHNKPKIVYASDDPETLWRQVEPLLEHVEEIYFAGGEPLVMEEHYRILDALAARRKFDVRLLYNTNFSIMTFKGRDVMRLWDQFRTVRVGASLDAMGRRGEYLRKGQIWEQAVRNRERMFEICPRTEFSISPTLSAMNALHLPEFHREWLEKGYVGECGMYINFLLDPVEYRVQVLPTDLKRRMAEMYERHIDQVVRRSGEHWQGVAERFQAAISFAAAQDLSSELPKFRETVSKLDAIRGESFPDVFPEMAEVYRG
jgi:radical SAM protein with 4Fe4S-binding SPASM domain